MTSGSNVIISLNTFLEQISEIKIFNIDVLMQPGQKPEVTRECQFFSYYRHSLLQLTSHVGTPLISHRAPLTPLGNVNWGPTHCVVCYGCF